jgi:hypothetical protein
VDEKFLNFILFSSPGCTFVSSIHLKTKAMKIARLILAGATLVALTLSPVAAHAQNDVKQDKKEVRKDEDKKAEDKADRNRAEKNGHPKEAVKDEKKVQKDNKDIKKDKKDVKKDENKKK